ncbi:hypothetical protein VM1G_08136 [Cytospora mali]|uniref:Uncharacterized protein n=1 Tax=Cytospora mali TaxID=578113 RepID=A0A194W933_CYTMA|nr:hypothetical protein VM1G_08136 [Valsa mali]
MTRLPSESFLPTSALDSDRQTHLSMAGSVDSHGSSSVISPLSLPGAVHYFDPAPLPSVTSHPNNNTLAATANHGYPPHLNGSSRDPPRAQPATFFSPHLTPIPSHAQRQLQFQRQPHQQRSASLSPTRRPTPGGRYAAMEGKRPTDVDLSPRITSGVPVPVDTISGTGSGIVTVRRPAAAVRTFSSETASVDTQSSSLEAKMRQAWDDERRALQANRDRAEEVYRDTIEALRREHDQEHLQWEAERYMLQSQIMQLQNRLQEVEAHRSETSLRGGGSNSRRRSVSFQRGPSQISPTRQPDFSPLDPRDTLSLDSVVAMDQEQPSKVIDVQEYHRDLEGIHLKENAVKKATFTDTPSSNGSNQSSGSVSPPPHLLETQRQTARERSMQALKADELSRLTIHAGHTPTVSLSIVSTDVSNTVVSSGSNTPTLTSGDGALSDGNENNFESSEPAEPVPTGQDDEDYEPAILEPSDEDPELKGPLTLRNMPAKDEIFLRKLADKLEKVGSGGEDATPTVLRHPDEDGDEDEDIGEPSAATAGAVAEGDSEGVEGVEEHIPLKIKKTSNFGKPLGSL